MKLLRYFEFNYRNYMTTLQSTYLTAWMSIIDLNRISIMVKTHTLSNYFE